jgi:hypothetical protein
VVPHLNTAPQSNERGANHPIGRTEELVALALLQHFDSVITQVHSHLFSIENKV